MKNVVPIYFAAGMIEKAHFYYKLFANWMSEKIKSQFFNSNMFEFKHIQPFDRNLIKRFIKIIEALLLWFSLPHQECFTVGSLCKYSKNGVTILKIP